MKRICAILLVVFVVGCAPVWKKTDGPFQSEQIGFTANFPAGWAKEVSKHKDKVVYIQKKGIPLGGFYIEKIEFEDATKENVKFKRGMLLHEIIETTIDEFKVYKSISDVTVLEISNATISEMPGAKAIFTYRNRNNLVMKTVFYVVINGDYFYKLMMSAPRRHYFDIYIDDFETMVASFKIVKS